jgi:hypothetical protein
LRIQQDVPNGQLEAAGDFSRHMVTDRRFRAGPTLALISSHIWRACQVQTPSTRGLLQRGITCEPKATASPSGDDHGAGESGGAAGTCDGLSSHAWQVLSLAERGVWARAVGYVLGSNGARLLRAWLRASPARLAPF